MTTGFALASRLRAELCIRPLDLDISQAARAHDLSDTTDITIVNVLDTPSKQNIENAIKYKIPEYVLQSHSRSF